MRRSTTFLSVLLAGCIVHVAAAQQAGRLTVRDQQRAQEIAYEKGWPVRIDRVGGPTLELRAIDNGIPRYFITHNRDAADSISVDECWPTGSSGLSLSGAGVILGVWDGGGVRVSHQEFAGRATQLDSVPYIHYHATHVAGTMIAAGVVQKAKGMSFEATLDCYDWDNDEDEMKAAAAAGLQVSNHSYGFIHGWILDDLGMGWAWYWVGDWTVSELEDHWFGRYTAYTQEQDQIAYDNPNYLICKSAGNDRGEGPPPATTHWIFDPSEGDWVQSTTTRDKDGPYDCVGTTGSAKNILTVGAVWDVVGGYNGPGSVGMSSFSAWGPVDDGRIKPDVVGNGMNLYSTDSDSDTDYYTLSGTSMSTPNVSGGLGLLLQRWSQTRPLAETMRSATLKGLVIHTADEAGDYAGPDYEYGWGLVNILKAARLLAPATDHDGRVYQLDLLDGAEYELSLVANPIIGPDDELRVTICWTDPPGTPPAEVLDDPTKMLVNDLDLRIEGPGSVQFEPWILDPANPSAAATTGDNNSDNVEQVVIKSADLVAGAQYIVRVTHKGSLTDGMQAFSLVLSGAASVDCNSNSVADGDEIAGDPSLDCNSNGILDECEVVPPPKVTSHPASVDACNGDPVTFGVSADGYDPFTYQWRKGGANISGATGATYTIPMATDAHVGEYDVIVYDACGSVTSNKATLSVRPCPPGIPSLINPADDGTGVDVDATLRWVPTPRATEYDVYFGVTSPPELVATTTVAEYPLHGLNHLRMYYWRVVARNHLGETSGPVWSFRTMSRPVISPAMPASPEPADGASGVVLGTGLSWEGSDWAEFYQVFVGVDSMGAMSFMGSTAAPSWEFTEFEKDTTYYWQIVATNQGLHTEGPVWSFSTGGSTASPSTPSTDQPPDNSDQPQSEEQRPTTGTGGPTGGGTTPPGTPAGGVCPVTAGMMVSLTVLGLWLTRPRRAFPRRPRS